MTVYSLKWVKHNFPPHFSFCLHLHSFFFYPFPVPLMLFMSAFDSLLILFPNPCTPLLIHDQKQTRKDMSMKKIWEAKKAGKTKYQFSFTPSLPSSLTFECTLCFSSLFSCLNQIQGPSFPFHSRNKNWFTRFREKSQES